MLKVVIVYEFCLTLATLLTQEKSVQLNEKDICLFFKKKTKTKQQQKKKHNKHTPQNKNKKLCIGISQYQKMLNNGEHQDVVRLLKNDQVIPYALVYNYRKLRYPICI